MQIDLYKNLAIQMKRNKRKPKKMQNKSNLIPSTTSPKKSFSRKEKSNISYSKMKI
jgi:hypothetical protein